MNPIIESVVLDYQSSSQDDRWGGAALAAPTVADPADPRVVFFRDVNPMGKIPALKLCKVNVMGVALMSR